MGAALVNARDRIGNGPWYNANGDLCRLGHRGLHTDQNNMRKPNSVDENGEVVNGAGDQPNRHDILTGSDSRGNLAAGSGSGADDLQQLDEQRCR